MHFLIDAKRFVAAFYIAFYNLSTLTQRCATGEIDTSHIIERVFKDRKRCFVPRCTSNSEMLMLEAMSVKDILSFSKNKWQIPEPPQSENRAEAMECKELDLIIVPGVAFDEQNRRCGHGAG